MEGVRDVLRRLVVVVVVWRDRMVVWVIVVEEAESSLRNCGFGEYGVFF